MKSLTTSYKLLATNLIRRIKLRTWVGVGIIFVLLPMIVFGVVYKDSILAALSGSDANPAGHWAFDEGTANTCSGGTNDACDNSGSGNDGAFGATTAAPTIQTEDLCISGKCLFFDGTDDTVTVANTVASVQSVAFWVKVMSTSTTQEILALNGTDTFSSVSGTLTVGGFGTDTIYVDGVAGSTSLTASGWHHVVVTTTAGVSASAITMGNISTNFGNIFLDELKLFTVELSADQVKAEFAGGAAVFSDKSAFLSDGLVGYWRLDESSGNASDSSGNSLTLTNNGTTTFVGGKFGNGSEHVPASSQHFSTATTITGVKTVSFWTNPDSTTNYYVSLTSGAYITSSSGTLSATGFTSPTIYVNGVATTTIAADSWQLVTVTTDTAINADQFYLGRQDTNYYDGTLDEARVYSRSLSSREIQSLYNWAPGPVGYWKMDENTGVGTASDSSGNGNNGTIGTTTGSESSDPAWTTGKYGSALTFDGSDDFVNVGNPSTLDIGAETESYSWMTWVKMTSLQGSYFLQKGQFAQGNNKISYSIGADNTGGNNYLNCDIDDATNSVSVGGTADADALVALNTWYHVACVRDTVTDTVYMYINGVLVDSDTDITTSTDNPTIDLRFGSQAVPGTFWAGTLDDVKIYRYARTSQQVIEDMNGGHPTGGSPIGTQYRYWHFNEGYGQIANDQTNNDPGELAGSSTTQAADPTWAMPVNCKNGGCLDFESGNSEFVGSIGSLALDNDSFSLSAWAKRESTGADMDILFSGSSAQHNGLRFGFVSTDVFRCGFFSNDLDTTTTYTDTDWHHWMCTYNATNNARKIYRDGIVVASDTASADFQGTGSTWIGSNINGATNFFDGLIDEVKVYSDELTPTEVGIDMNAGATINFGTGYIEETQDIGAGNPPVGYWDMDEGSWTNDCSTDTVFDKSGNSFNADSCPASTGPTGGQNSKIGKGGSFDGVNDYLTIADNAILRPSTFSISFWLKKNSTVDNFDWIIDKSTGTTQGFGILFDNSSPQKAYMAAFNTVGGETNTATVNTTLAVDIWRHMAYSFDGSTIYVYENGILLDTVAFTGTFQVSTESIFIASEDGDSNWAPISIDDLKFYDYARTATQVAYDYNRGRPIAWWQFDECSGATANNNGSLDSALNGTITPQSNGNTAVGDCDTSATTMWFNGATGKFNSSLDFDGNDDYVSIPDTTATDFVTNGDNFSISAWVYPEDATTGAQRIVHKTETLTPAANWNITWTGDSSSTDQAFVFTFQSDSNFYDAETPGGLATGQWYHIVGVRTGATSAEIWINGRRYTTDNSATLGGGLENLFTIGTRTRGTPDHTDFFDGKIDDVRIYNYALSEAQIQKLMNNDAGARFGPVTGSP